MKFTRHYAILLKSFMPFCGLCLLMSCSAEEEMQLARLIEAHAYDKDSLKSFALPLNGGGILPRDAIIELVFDKPVLQVSINYSGRAQPDEMSPATVWRLESNRLKDVWDLQIGWNPAKNVALTIIYEDEIGIHKDTLDVTSVEYHIDVFPPEVSHANISNNQVDVDADRLNQEGIQISFDMLMDTRPSRTKIKVYSGPVMLDWRIDCWTLHGADYRYGVHTVTLLPQSKDDWLLPGHEYEIHLIDFYDYPGNRGGGLEDGPIVINFQTASE